MKIFIYGTLCLSLSLLASCGPSISSVQEEGGSRIPPITGESHEERVANQEEILRQQELEKERQDEEIRHLERQRYYNELMRNRADSTGEGDAR